jgi:hypothetical protein
MQKLIVILWFSGTTMFLNQWDMSHCQDLTVRTLINMVPKCTELYKYTSWKKRKREHCS